MFSEFGLSGFLTERGRQFPEYPQASNPISTLDLRKTLASLRASERHQVFAISNVIFTKSPNCSQILPAYRA